MRCTRRSSRYAPSARVSAVVRPENTSNMSENDVRNHYLRQLEDHFIIETEIPGKHFSGKTLKIDAVVRPRDTNSWKNPAVALGIEFKDSNRYSENYDTKDFTKWLAQCVDYSNTNWVDYGYIYIFTCPSLIEGVAPGVIGEPMFVENFMGQIGIGELKNISNYGVSFVLHGHHRIWSVNAGVEFGKHYSLKRKFGSR